MNRPRLTLDQLVLVRIQIRQHVRVGVYRLGDGGVPEHLLHYVWVYGFAEKQGRGRVPEIVEAYLRQPGALQEEPEETVPWTCETGRDLGQRTFHSCCKKFGVLVLDLLQLGLMNQG